ncbi:MAG TPA: malic enzyme-like NAD(P)-binding protein, partial [Candidatus Dormibacteraeota bacterium]|nr:malic enzyme-like NAD(P)-binding protein [Candidatus Dormibacteraeota bacterium]
PRAFTESVIREMSTGVERPIILPLTNPTALSEATPEDLLEWTGGRALIATGSPFAPVVHAGVEHVIGQANNAFVFPGIGLGTIAVRASRVSDGMLSAAADAVVAMTDVSSPGSSLLPDVERLRDVSIAVAVAVAHQAIAEGIARTPQENVEAAVRAAIWEPVYRPVIASN